MILLAVGWYLRFPLSYRDVEELLNERAGAPITSPSGANGLFQSLKSPGILVVAFGAEPNLPTPASFTVATDIKGLP